MNATDNIQRPKYSIRFPLIKERIKHARRGEKRFRFVPDKSKLSGARSCAAGCISSAILYRGSWMSQSTSDTIRRMNRLGMRAMALWARVFASQIDANDNRLKEVEGERIRLAQTLLIP